MTTQSSGLARNEIRTMKPEESAWSSVAIKKRLIPPTRIWTTKPKESAWSSVAIEKWLIPPIRTQWSTGLRWQHSAPLHQVALHLSPDFSTIRPQGRAYGTNRDSRFRTGVRWVINKQCTTASKRIYSRPISRAWLARTGQYDIFIPSRYAYSIQNSKVS
jgi:hypothetical protein